MVFSELRVNGDVKGTVDKDVLVVIVLNISMQRHQILTLYLLEVTDYLII